MTQHADLHRLLDEIKTAKLVHQRALDRHPNASMVESTRTDWRSALTTYMDALDARHLPIPPRLHRDLEILRCLGKRP